MTDTIEFNDIGVPDTDRGTWFQTFMGGRFYPLDPQSHEIDPRDIARGLAYQCRFVGQVSHFYSIAQHSVLCADMALEEYGDNHPLARVMLMHDATEAYVGDMNRPLKSLLPDYRDIEHATWRAIARRFVLPLEMAPEVKAIDNKVLAIEKAALCPNAEPWPGVDDIETQSPFMAWTPEYSLAMFSTKFYDLFRDDVVFRKAH